MAVYGKLKRIQSTNPELNRIQDATIAAVNPVLACPIVNGNLVTGVNLDRTKDNVINTGLARNFIGWFTTRRSNAVGFVDIFESSTTNNSPDKFLILNCLSDITVDIWIF